MLLMRRPGAAPPRRGPAGAGARAEYAVRLYRRLGNKSRKSFKKSHTKSRTPWRTPAEFPPHLHTNKDKTSAVTSSARKTMPGSRATWVPPAAVRSRVTTHTSRGDAMPHPQEVHRRQGVVGLREVGPRSFSVRRVAPVSERGAPRTRGRACVADIRHKNTYMRSVWGISCPLQSVCLSDPPAFSSVCRIRYKRAALAGAATCRCAATRAKHRVNTQRGCRWRHAL